LIPAKPFYYVEKSYFIILYFIISPSCAASSGKTVNYFRAYSAADTTPHKLRDIVKMYRRRDLENVDTIEWYCYSICEIPYILLGIIIQLRRKSFSWFIFLSDVGQAPPRHCRHRDAVIATHATYRSIFVIFALSGRRPRNGPVCPGRRDSFTPVSYLRGERGVKEIKIVRSPNLRPLVFKAGLLDNIILPPHDKIINTPLVLRRCVYNITYIIIVSAAN